MGVAIIQSVGIQGKFEKYDEIVSNYVAPLQRAVPLID